jgi:hypothetical protein
MVSFIIQQLGFYEQFTDGRITMEELKEKLVLLLIDYVEYDNAQNSLWESKNIERSSI